MAGSPKAPELAPDAYDMNKKLEINNKADAKNVIAQTRTGKRTLRCGADKSKKKGPGAVCMSFAGTGTDHPGSGRCKFCGGMSTGPRTAEGKAVVSQNNTLHGLYASVLGARERELYEELSAKDNAAVTLEHEILVQKAKILSYLERKQKDWERHRDAKLAEHSIKFRCSAMVEYKKTECGHVFTRGSLDGKPGHCPVCAGRPANIAEVDRWPAEHSELTAIEYADHKSKIYFTEGESGIRSFYHAATIEDRALDRALRTLSNLVEKQARMKGDDRSDLIDAVNKELRAASQGQVSLSWSTGQAQNRKET